MNNKMLPKILSSQIFHTILVLRYKQEKSQQDVAKVQIKSEKLTPFGRHFFNYGTFLIKAFTFCRHDRAFRTLTHHC